MKAGNIIYATLGICLGVVVGLDALWNISPMTCPEATSELVPMQPVVQQPLAPGHYVVTDGVLVKQPEPLENHQL